MALVANLQASFAADGFDLDVTVGGVGGQLDATAVAPISLDTGALSAIREQLSAPDLQGLAASVGGAAGSLGSVTGLVPDLGALLRPLGPALSTLALAGADPAGLAGLGATVRGLDSARTGSGIDAVLPAVTAAAALSDHPAVRGLTQIVTRAVPGLDLQAPAAAVTGGLAGVAGLVHLVGGLMAVESITRDLTAGVATTASFLDAGRIEAGLAQLDAWVDSGAVVDLLVGIDPDDPGVVDLVAGVVETYVSTVRELGSAVVTGMAFGEATLAGLDVPELVARVDEASALVRRADLTAVAALAVDLRARLDAFLTFDLPAPPLIDDFLAGVGEVVSTMAAAIDRFQPAVVTDPIRGALTTVTAPLEQVEQAAREVVAGATAALGAVRSAVTAVDLRPVTDAVAAVLAPITAALDALEALVGDAQAAITAAADAVDDVVTPAQQALTTAATAITRAFTAVRDAVDVLGLDEIGATLTDDAQQVAGAIAAAQLRPVFDVVVGALETAADALRLVPRDLLPDDVRAALDAACGRLQAVDLEPVRASLNQELADLVASVDVTVLDAVRQAQQAVVGFLDTIDPRPRVQALEDGPFADLVTRLRAVDPRTPLAPVIAAVDEAKAAITGFDPAAALRPLDEVVDTVVDALAAFDPAALLGPIEQQVTAARQTIMQTLQLDRFEEWLDTAAAFVDGVLDRFDPGAMAAALDEVHQSLVAEAARPDLGPGPVGTVVTALVEGTGLRVRADAFADVALWLDGSASAQAVVAQRLSAALGTIQRLTATVAAVDLTGVVGRLDAHHSRLVAALSAHADTSRLRLRLDATLAGSAPGALLGGVLVNRDRYLTALADGAAALTRLVAASRSELDEAATALRTATAPLTAVLARVRALLHATTGVVVDGRPLRAVLVELLDRLRPSLLLGPIADALDRLRDRIRTALDGALWQPLRDALGTVRSLVQTLDLSFVRTELTAARDDVVVTVEQLRPTAVLGDLLADVTALQARIAGFDPIGPVRAVTEALADVITTFETELRPTVLAAPALAAYDTVRDTVDAIAVDDVLRPVLDALDGVSAQLEDGMNRLIDALHGVQDACASGGPSLGAALGAAAGVAGALSVGVSGGFGL